MDVSGCRRTTQKSRDLRPRDKQELAIFHFIAKTKVQSLKMRKCCLTVQEHPGLSWKEDGSLAGAFRLFHTVFALILSALASRTSGFEQQQAPEEAECSLTVQGSTGSYLQFRPAALLPLSQ